MSPNAWAMAMWARSAWPILPIPVYFTLSCAWLGLELDATANAAHGPRISTPQSAVSAWVIPTDEEILIARRTLEVPGAAGYGQI